MAKQTLQGMYRRGADGVWHARKGVPADVRSAIGKREFIASLGTSDTRLAKSLAADFQRRWASEIARVRQEDAAKPLDMAHCERRIMAMVGLMVVTGYARIAPEPVASGFDLLQPPPRMALRIAMLRQAATEGHGWEAVPGFDAWTDYALTLSQIAAKPGHPQWADLQAILGRALLDASLIAERGRQVHAAQDHLAGLSSGTEPLIGVDLIPAPAYQPRASDRTVRQLIDQFRLERAQKHGDESTARKYGHIFRAVEEIAGGNRIVRTLTRDDCKRVRDTFRSIPVHAGKRYPGLSVLQAVEKGGEDDAPVIAPNTVNSYLANFNAMLNYAVEEGIADSNPASRLVMKDLPLVKRRGFTPGELGTIFAALKGERETVPHRWWVPTLALYTGARANELCQLRAGDVRVHVEGEVRTPYLALSVYEADGRRAGKRLKTMASERNVPLHPAIANAFIRFVGERDRAELLFPEIKRVSDLPLSHMFSRWFGGFMNGVGLSDPALVFHSFRHGFRDAAEVAGRITNALGGWSAESVSERYGSPEHIPLLAREIGKISYGNFTIDVEARTAFTG